MIYEKICLNFSEHCYYRYIISYNNDTADLEPLEYTNVRNIDKLWFCAGFDNIV